MGRTMPIEQRDTPLNTAERLVCAGYFLATADGHPFNGESKSWG